MPSHKEHTRSTKSAQMPHTHSLYRCDDNGAAIHLFRRVGSATFFAVLDHVAAAVIALANVVQAPAMSWPFFFFLASADASGIQTSAAHNISRRPNATSTTMTSVSALPPEIVAHVIGMAAQGDVGGLAALCQSHPLFRSLCTERIVRRSSLSPSVERFLPPGQLATPADVIRAYRTADQVRRCLRYSAYSMLARSTTGELRPDRLSFDEFAQADSAVDVLDTLPRRADRLTVQGSRAPDDVRFTFNRGSGDEVQYEMGPMDPDGPARALVNALFATAITSADADAPCAAVDLFSVFPGAAAYVRQTPPRKFMYAPRAPGTMLLSVDIDGILNDPASPAYRP
ncbi:hypothetical protein psal_cds_1077 [Pandoravirus salinus]|uniref:DUF5902 domain-containing protein n=1 Tax=Pandoravirus salinus TaxID=1349410 RepID=S4W0H6_9VIRU|nr:hypothetical protein psal_cds_1077 [Pandoravirus salinus]AGO85291.1 hypothetical protein psal_cds_1077 [Pandoravirus salinus]